MLACLPNIWPFRDLTHELQSDDHTDEGQQIHIDLTSDSTIVLGRDRILRREIIVDLAHSRKGRVLGVEGVLIFQSV